MTKETNAFVAPTPLLQALEEDLEAAGKRSVKDCLRSKTLPRPQVKKVLENSNNNNNMIVDKTTLQISHSSVLSKYLGSLKQRGTAAAENNDTVRNSTTNKSSMWYISRLATVMRFLQLLFEYSSNKDDEQDNNTAAEINKMLQQEIQSLTGVVCTCLSSTASTRVRENPYTCDASVSFDPIPIACFVFSSLVRINNHYVRVKPFLLSPLWKGLCELANSMTFLPPELLTEAVKALLDYLKEGIEPTLAACTNVLQQEKHVPDSNEQQQQAFQVKVLGFLITRLSVFLPLLPIDDDDDAATTITSNTFAQVVSVLSCLRGIAVAVESSPSAMTRTSHRPHSLTSFLKSYRQLATKVEKCVNSALRLDHSNNNNNTNDDNEQQESDESDSRILHTALLRILIKSKAVTWGDSKNEEALNLSESSFALGKTLLLGQIHENVLSDAKSACSWSEADVESLLLICQTLLFSSLPCCYGSFRSEASCTNDLLSLTIRRIRETLLLCESLAPCIASNANPGRGRFHRWLVSWLAPSQGNLKQEEHPMTTELTVFIVHLHILSLFQQHGLEAAAPLLSLLVRLFFDGRTRTEFRSHIAAVLVRLLSSCDSSSSSKTATNSNASLQEKVQKLIMSGLIPLEQNMRPGSRKRQRSSDTRENGLGVEDFKLIAFIISCLSGPNMPPIDNNSPRPFSFPVDGAPLTLKALEYAALRVAISTASLRAGREYEGDAIDYFTKIWYGKTREGRQEAHFAKRLEWLGTTVMRYIFVACESGATKRGLSTDKVNQICRLLASVCTENELLHISNYLPMALEAIKVLGSIGKALHPSSPQEILQDLAKTFHQLLSCELWPVRSVAMSSLVSFASSIPVAHKNVLPSCVPSDMQKLLQCRLQDSLDEASTAGLEFLQMRYARALSRVSTSRRLDDKIFPASNSCNIPAGSFFMTMPTQGGRKAIVIFPPGHESIEDIKYMLALDDDDEKPQVQTLHRTVAQEDGSCQLFLRE